MIKTKIYQNKNNVYVLEIYIDNELVQECYNEKDEIALSEIASIAEDMYRRGFDYGYNLCLDEN